MPQYQKLDNEQRRNALNNFQLYQNVTQYSAHNRGFGGW